MTLYIRSLTSPASVKEERVIFNENYFVTETGKRFYKDSLLEVGFKPLYKAYLFKNDLEDDTANIINQVRLRATLNEINVHTLSNEDVEAITNILSSYGRQRRRNGVLQNTKSPSQRKALAIRKDV